MKPDPEPEKGFFYRSDHFEFAKHGRARPLRRHGHRVRRQAARVTASRSATSTPRSDYHKPSDEVKPDWDLSGAVEDAHFLLDVGYRVAQGDKYPEWKPGTEFKALRDKSLGGASQ